MIGNNATLRRRSNLGQILKLSTQVFDRQLKKRQKNFSFQSYDNYYDYLREESDRRLVDRIEDITRKFPTTLELGCYRGYVSKFLEETSIDSSTIGGIQTIIQCDLFHSPTLENPNHQHDYSTIIKKHRIQCDEEYLPFESESFDLVMSSMALHWINDLPSALRQINDVLKPDGVFIGSMLGGSTLQELKHCFYLAEAERRGGLSSHMSPYILASDVAGIVQSVGFSLPTVDVDVITISYPDAFTLMEHIFRMGEGSASLNRQYNVGMDTFLAVAALYQELYGMEDGSVPATFELINMIGWKPHQSQPVACKRGTGTKSLKDLNYSSNSSQ